MNKIYYIIKQLDLEKQFSSNLFLLKLPSTSIDNFIHVKHNFVYAIDNWMKFLLLLSYKLPSYKERMILLKNINDEHGNNNINKVHINTFDNFINSFDGSIHIDIYNKNNIVFPIIDKFIHNINEKLNENNWIHNSAMLGIIELLYIQIC